MYTILKLEEKKKMTWGEKFRKLLFDISPKRAFLELSYDPLSGYLIYRDHTKEVPMKKDLIRALVVYAEIRDRAELFDLELEVTVNQIIKFIQKAQNPIIDDHIVIGPERLPERDIVVILKEFLNYEELNQIAPTIISRQVIYNKF
mgnify:CR=1 FL=1